MITATITNKMRQPIDVIMTKLDTLQTQVAGQKQQMATANMIKTSSQCLRFLVSDMLDIHMIKSGKFIQNESKIIIRDMLKNIY